MKLVKQHTSRSNSSACQVLRNVFATSREREYFFRREQMELSLPGSSTRSSRVTTLRTLTPTKVERKRTSNIKTTHVRTHHGFWAILHHVLSICQTSSKLLLALTREQYSCGNLGLRAIQPCPRLTLMIRIQLLNLHLWEKEANHKLVEPDKLRRELWLKSKKREQL